MTLTIRGVVAASALAALVAPQLSVAQTAAATTAATTAAAATPSPTAQTAPAFAPLHRVKVPEGTEVRVKFNDNLSSGKNSEGDEFSITLDDDITLPDGTIIKRGYRGKGEVTQAKKKGMMGQAGEMNVRLDYLKVGDTRIHLRGNRGGEGQGAMGATIALTVLFGPLGLLKHGHDVEIHAGQTLTAYVDEDTTIGTPIDPPPHDD